MGENLKAYYDKLGICKEVKRLVESRAWKEVLEPWLNVAITKCVGGKTIDKQGLVRWDGGTLQKPEDESPEYYIARKQALMDFYNMVYNHLRVTEGYENKIKVLEERASKESKHPTRS